MKPPMSDLAKVIIGGWILLGIVGAVFFLGGDNAALKRKLFPYFITLICGVFFVLIWFIQGQIPLPFFILVPVIGWLNLRMTRFCDGCGRMVISRNLFVSPKYCQGCGARLED